MYSLFYTCVLATLCFVHVFLSTCELPIYFLSYSSPEFNIDHLLTESTETEGNSEFCGPETAVVSRGEAEGNSERSRGHKTQFSRGLSKKVFVI